MTKNELKDYIKAQLGWPMLKVELHDTQLDYNINKARAEHIKWAVGNSTQEISFTMPLSAHQTEYELPSGITTITRIKDFSSGRLGAGGGINTLFSTSNILYNMGFLNFLRGYSTYNMVSYHLARQYMDVLDKYSSSKYIFKYYNFSNTLHVQPPPPSGEYIETTEGTIESPGFIMIRAFIISEYGLESDEPDIYDEWLWDETWVQEYATALSKITLGRVRSKFANGPTSIGNTSIQLDGDTLLQEGREDKEKLEERLRSEEPSIGHGIIIG